MTIIGTFDICRSARVSIDTNPCVKTNSNKQYNNEKVRPFIDSPPYEQIRYAIKSVCAAINNDSPHAENGKPLANAYPIIVALKLNKLSRNPN